MDENKMNDDVLEEDEDIEETEALINDKWYIDLCEEEPETVVKEYDITATPNDFNILTLFSLIDNGVIKMPPFQRNYVWDEKRASKLIESIILGLPIPQVFLYEQGKNSFYVIDGQQRLLSIYFFVKQRFPTAEGRLILRQYLTGEKAEEPANICWIIEKAREFQKNIYFCFIDYAKALTVWIMTNCGKFFKRWGYQTT